MCVWGVCMCVLEEVGNTTVNKGMAVKRSEGQSSYTDKQWRTPSQ